MLCVVLYSCALRTLVPYMPSCPTCLACSTYLMCPAYLTYFTCYRGLCTLRALRALVSYVSSCHIFLRALRVLLGLRASHVIPGSLVLIVLFTENKNVLRFLVRSVKENKIEITTNYFHLFCIFESYLFLYLKVCFRYVILLLNGFI